MMRKKIPHVKVTRSEYRKITINVNINDPEQVKDLNKITSNASRLYEIYTEGLLILALKDFLKKKNYYPSRKELWAYSKNFLEKQLKRILKQTGLQEFMLTAIATDSKLRYWTRYLIQNNIIGVVKDERPQKLFLTGLGEWIADGPIDEMTLRIAFSAQGICRNCTTELDIIKRQKLAVLKPIIKTAWTSERGNLHVDMKCPVCNSYFKDGFIMYGVTVDVLKDFYNKAVKELPKYFKEVYFEKID